jgi:outer membrane protein
MPKKPWAPPSAIWKLPRLNLRTYTGAEGEDKIALELPGATINMDVSADKVLAEAFANRSDAIAFMRRVAEAKRDVAKAKGQSGWWLP